MNEKALMRKTKVELLKILKTRGEKPSPKTLKKDLVQLILASEPAPKKIAKAQKPRQRTAAKRSPAADGAENISAVAAGRSLHRDDEVKRAAEVSTHQESPQAWPGEPHVVQEDPVEYAPPGPTNLSRRYGEDRIAAMMRDPYWIFAYWEITPQGLEHARCKLDGGDDSANIALRVYDVSGVEFTGENANSAFDIDVGADADNWYINTGRPGSTYCVDIGLLRRDGSFLTIARSECINTPRATASDKVDDRWMSPEGEFEQVYALSGGLETGAASADLQELMQKQLQARISS
jgi:hypothetical protein